MRRCCRGAALVVGLLLLSLITMLALASGAAAHVELQLARNEQFRENAASAASAGIETALTQVIASASDTVPSRLFASLPDSTGRYEVNVRFLGYEALPQQPGANLVGAHFEILSTGFAGRGAEDRQRAIVMLNVAGTDPAGLDCEPLVTGAACAQAGALHRLSWQRAPSP